MGLLMGVVAIRRQGIYFAMSTLALSQMAYFLFLRAPFTNAKDGIQNVPRGYAFGADRYRLGAFVISASLAGLAGATKALLFQIATLTDVAW